MFHSCARHSFPPTASYPCVVAAACLLCIGVCCWSAVVAVVVAVCCRVADARVEWSGVEPRVIAMEAVTGESRAEQRTGLTTRRERESERERRHTTPHTTHISRRHTHTVYTARTCIAHARIARTHTRVGERQTTPPRMRLLGRSSCQHTMSMGHVNVYVLVCMCCVVSCVSDSCRDASSLLLLLLLLLFFSPLPSRLPHSPLSLLPGLHSSGAWRP